MDSAYSASTLFGRPRANRSIGSRRSMIALALATALSCLGLALGAQSASASFTCISLDPPTANNQLPQDTTHTVTATVRVSYDPIGHPNSDGPAAGNTTGDYSVWWIWDDYYKALYPNATDRFTDFYQTTFLNSLYPGVCSDPNVPAQLPVLPNAPVSFIITSGPSAGQIGNATTDANGQATFTWSNGVPGTDSVSASTFSNFTPPSPLTTDPPDGSGVDVLSGPVTATAVKNWLPPIPPPPPPPPPPPAPPVTPSAVPAAVLRIPGKCRTRRFYIRASTSGGKVRKMVLKIDRKRAKVRRTIKRSTSRRFLIDTGRYKAGTHRVTLTTYFTNGRRVTKTGRFRLCKVRTSRARVSPRFTG